MRWYEYSNGTGYEQVLEAMGFTVVLFKEFGSYQGDWFAKVEGGWITGYYGSCSGCDALQGEFDDDGDHPAEVWKEKLRKFGKAQDYSVITQDKAEEHAARNVDWDSDAAEMLAWVKENA